MTVTPEQVSKTLKDVLTAAAFIVRLTKTEVDDEVLSKVSSVLTQPWAAQLIAFLVNTFSKEQLQTLDVLLKNAVENHKV